MTLSNRSIRSPARRSGRCSRLLARARRCGRSRGAAALLSPASCAPAAYPFAGASLVVRGVTAGGANVVKLLKSDRDGTFVLGDAAEGLYTVLSVVPGFRPALARLLHRAVPDGALSFVRLDLESPAGILPEATGGPLDVWIARAVAPGDVLRDVPAMLAALEQGPETSALSPSRSRDVTRARATLPDSRVGRVHGGIRRRGRVLAVARLARRERDGRRQAALGGFGGLRAPRGALGREDGRCVARGARRLGSPGLEPDDRAPLDPPAEHGRRRGRRALRHAFPRLERQRLGALAGVGLRPSRLAVPAPLGRTRGGPVRARVECRRRRRPLSDRAFFLDVRARVDVLSEQR